MKIFLAHILIAIIGFLIGLIIALSWSLLSGFKQAESLIDSEKKDTYIKKYDEAVNRLDRAGEGDSSLPVPPKIALVTAYSCGGLTTEALIKMNCPSLVYGGPKTASGTIPTPSLTVACDPANLGRRFHLANIGEVVCEDTGGSIKGAGRFDIYLSTLGEAREFGVQYLEYYEM